MIRRVYNALYNEQYDQNVHTQCSEKHIQQQ